MCNLACVTNLVYNPVMCTNICLSISMYSQVVAVSHNMWRPDPAGTGTPLRRIYVGRKYPHVYTLSISTGKNQRRKYVVIYIPTEKYKYMVITEKRYNITGILHTRKYKSK